MPLKLISKKEVDAYFSELGQFHQMTETTGREKTKSDFVTGIDSVIQMALETHEKGGKLMFIGNGGSAAISSHMAIDYWKNGGIRSTAFNDPALLTCLSNDYGYEHVFEKTIAMLGQPHDLLIAISSSGRSQNILNGVKASREKNCQVVTLSGFKPDNPLRNMGDINFYVPSEAYGFVEIFHLSICHVILDMACKLKIKKGTS